MSLGLGIAFLPFVAWGQAPATTFSNPIGVSDIPQLFNKITRWILGIVGFIALLSLIWGGTMYIISFGDEAGIKRAKTIVIWSTVGLAIILLAFFIVQTVGRILGVAGI